MSKLRKSLIKKEGSWVLDIKGNQHIFGILYKTTIGGVLWFIKEWIFPLKAISHFLLRTCNFSCKCQWVFGLFVLLSLRSSDNFLHCFNLFLWLISRENNYITFSLINSEWDFKRKKVFLHLIVKFYPSNNFPEISIQSWNMIKCTLCYVDWNKIFKKLFSCFWFHLEKMIRSKLLI